MRTYDASSRSEAVKLAGEIGSTKAAKELSIPSGTLDTWLNKAKKGMLPAGTSNPKRALNLAEENKRLQQENREKSLAKPPKHAALLAEIQAIIEEDEYNDKYGRERIHDAQQTTPVQPEPIEPAPVKPQQKPATSHNAEL